MEGDTTEGVVPGLREDMDGGAQAGGDTTEENIRVPESLKTKSEKEDEMAVTGTSGVSAPTNIFSKEAPKAVEGTTNAFGQDTFLKLLVTQLRFQDPSEPINNEQFLQQMAQFTSVEQIAKLNKTIESMAGSSKKSDALNMLGAEVTIIPTDQVEGATGEVTGIVDQIRFEGTNAVLQVGGKEYSFDDVVKVRVPTLESR